MRALVWFREDLRTIDNKALYFASKQASDGVYSIFLNTPQFWQQHQMAPLRIAFLKQGVKLLAEKLADYYIPLQVKKAICSNEMAQTLLRYAQEIKATDLFFNKQYEWNELKRDEGVIKLFQQSGLNVHTFDDQIIFPADKIVTQSHEAFKVFTPFKRAWIRYATQYGLPAPYPAPLKQKQVSDLKIELNLTELEDEPSSAFPALSFWPIGETEALQRLQNFIEDKIHFYADLRDFPKHDMTSKLSPYLSTGMISSRQCFQAALNFNHGEFDVGNKGATTWMSELIWREFYKMILIAFPHVAKHRPFKPETEKLPWVYNDSHFKAWCEGQTGYPLVDAAMRQLKQTGWMHNRLRMVAGMFLSKTLFINWQLGEQFFTQHLIDGDLAANNGGWQWVASTGVDAVPYFRVFNPILQSQKFDPDGDFIKQYCPELHHHNSKTIHQPWKYQDMFSKPLHYPKPIVDHDTAKRKVIAAFKELKKIEH